MPSNLQLSTGVPYLTLGSAEQVLWIMQSTPYSLHYLYHPSTYDIRVAFEFEDPFEELPRLYIIHLKTFAMSGEYSLPRDKTVSISQEHYYFFICALPCGDIKINIPGANNLNQKEIAKKLTGKPYTILDLSKADYGFPETQSRDEKALLDFYQPAPWAYHYKIKMGLPLTTTEDWEFSSRHKELIESLNEPYGYRLWGEISDSDMYSFFGCFYNEYHLFYKGEVSGLSTYLQPFLNKIKNSRVTYEFKAALADFALWCYFANRYWADHTHCGLTAYIPKRGKKKERNVKKAYIFKASKKAQQEWLHMLNGRSAL